MSSEDNHKVLLELLARLDRRLERVEDFGRDLNVILEKQYASLDEHMRRTALAENNIQLIYQELNPVKHQLAAFTAITKFISVIAAVTAVVYTFLRLAKLVP